MPPRSDLLPSIVLLVGAALWGLFWIPVRAIEQAGVSAIWTGPAIFGASTLFFLPLILLRFRNFVIHWRHILMPGMLAGFAFALYIASFNLTDVVRAILLFYMTPLWSTLLGMLVLGERLTANRAIALLLAFSGLYVVLVVDSGLPVPRNTGDWFALLSGLCWSVASVKLFQDGTRMVVEKVIAFTVCALFISLLMVLWQQGNLDGAPGLEALQDSGVWLVIMVVLMFPVTWSTIWPATLLSPARVGMLLLADVLVGVVSAAILLDEPFGLRELSGTVLIVAAGVVEVMRQQKLGNSVIVGDSN